MILLRYIGNGLLLIGQSFVLYGDIKTGILIKIIGCFLLIYCLTIEKMWDMVIVLLAFLLLDFSRLVSDLLIS